MLLQFGDKGDNVKYLQYGLHILCYSSNGFDGEFGNGTLTAVKKFQSKYGLVSDGIVGDVTWNTLKNEITTIQSQLNKKGFNVGTVDGVAGAATYNSVISFQSKNGLTADGQVGPATWDVLFDTISGGNSYSRILKLTSPLMYGEDIRAVQNKLNSLGYVAGTADGYYGNMTRNAVINFQSKKGLAADGDVGPTTWSALFNTSTSGGSGYSRILKLTSPLMYGEDIKAVQNRLNSLGYNAGTADGYYGNGTRTAVINFQTAKGLDADGDVGPTTWNALFNTSNSGGSGSTSNIRKVFIDPGHGGTDPGASGNGLYEKEVVLSISKKVRNILISKGFEVELSRSTDQYVSLSDRAAQANAWDADLFVSIHCNSATSSSANGTECYTYPTANTSTKSLSKNMASALASKLGLTNRGHKEANFAVLRLSNMPAILIETAFINNANDASKLKTRENDFASAIANQIANTSIDNSNGGSSNGNTSAEYSRNLEVTSPLMYGEDIRAVQNKLNSLGFNCGTADGYYGNDTKNAVINLQNTFGITADGIVGPTTWKYLFETNASVSNILKVAGNIGLFENAEFTFTELNSKTPEVRLSLSPAIYVQGELSLTGSLSGSMTNNYINLSLSPDTITTNIINNLSTINIEHDIDPKTLKASISQLTQTQNINDNISYSITLNDFGALEITLEAVIPANTDINFGGINLNLGVNLYQRLIVTIKPNRLPPPSNNGVISEIAIPLYKPESEILPNDVVIKNMKYVNYISLIAVALLTGMKVISTTLASTASGPLSILLALVFFILR
ncbi:peptidoglycan-binding protein [uncultured Clostridium sp.]|uniref:peptidoglycan-binding protein n=1 Tax=uncultured Clostridium sp. TaxID=59620 RepID=UPI00266F8A2F|nr:peptidoglycan-binding protein [uncultured Clostridium sp.]